ncbi:Two-component response regulator ARR1 [Acorus gramineus]|uniref:Two-component response regulator ARR1 n=1 Tax=Acorus gramineus TaxID=55184 RepID=A0AAV9BUG4_ACOGR|nr:Two-component response regulator ARR1 [Acorus gramineus]
MVKFVRVLVVDQDLGSLEDVANKLRELEYNVTTCSHAEEALALLREEGHGFNIIISDAHMPNMDGLKLLEQKNVPVINIVMSADEKSTKEVFMKAVEKGACHCLIKPVRSETLKYIWQHLVIMKRLLNQKSKSNELGNINKGLKMSQSSDGGSDDSVPTVQKKRRIQWTDELQQNFLIVVDKLGGAFSKSPFFYIFFIY